MPDYKFIGIPGPWHVEPRANLRNGIEVHAICSAAASIDDFAEVYIDPTLKNSYDAVTINAIASAPELFNAIVNLNEAIDNYWNTIHDDRLAMQKALCKQQQLTHKLILRILGRK